MVTLYEDTELFKSATIGDPHDARFLAFVVARWEPDEEDAADIVQLGSDVPLEVGLRFRVDGGLWRLAEEYPNGWLARPIEQ